MKYVPDLCAFLNHCELNYLRLHRCWPLLVEQRELIRQPCGQPWQLRLTLVAQAAYTGDLRLELYWPTRSRPELARMEVRLYHDAHLAEVLAYQSSRRFLPRYQYPNPQMLHVDEKQQLNLLLRDWLQWSSSL